MRALLVLATAVLGFSAGCTPRHHPEGRNAYACTVSAKQTDTELSVEHVAGAVVGGATSQRAAVLVDPSDGRQRYAVTRRYDLSGGIAFGRALLTVKPSLAELAPKIGTHVQALGTAGLAFVYERPEEKAALDILNARLPPSGWDRMIVSLKGAVAGDASAGIEGVLDVGADAELGLAAWVTIEADGAFSITRWWGGKVEAGAAVVGQRLGTTEFSGAVSAAAEVRFDRNGRPVQFRTIGEHRVGDRLVQTTGLLDLRAGRDPRMPALIAVAMTNPLNRGPSSGSVFFGTRQDNIDLWELMRREGTQVTARYKVVSSGIAADLLLPTFGVGFRRATTELTLIDIRIQPPGKKRTLTCTGEVHVPKAAAGPRRPQALKPRCVPPAREKEARARTESTSACLEAPKALLAVTPDAFAFPDTPVGDTAEPASFELRNAGGAPLRFSRGFLRGKDPQDFTIIDNTCTESLPPAETCVVTVAFRPTADGERRATLDLATSASGEPTPVTVAGTGIAGSAPGGDDLPDLVVAAVVRDEEQLIVTVRNTGSAGAAASAVTATFTSPGTTPEDADQRVPALPAGASDTVSLPVPTACLGGHCGVVVAVDADSDVPEQREDNNTHSRAL